MANSYVLIEFISVPEVDNYLGIDEAVSGLGLNEIFKTSRVASIQTKIPDLQSGRYEMTIPTLSDTDNLGIRYTEPGGVSKETPLYMVPVIDNPDGSYSFVVLSESPVVLYDLTTLESISWPGGSFENTGSYYVGFISENYKTALDLDYNSTGQFTIENTNGSTGSGLGIVKITANFVNAVFSLPEAFSFAIVTIHNEVVELTNNVTPDSLTFDVLTQVPNAAAKKLNIIANTGSWLVVGVLPEWLEISKLSGDNSEEISVKPVNYSTLAVGNYNYTLKINIDGDIFDVVILLSVKANIINPFKKDGLYFTRENIALSFISEHLNTYIKLVIEIKIFEINTNIESVYYRPYNFPLFKSKGDFYIGDIVEGLLNEINDLKDFIPDFRSNYVKKQFKPAEVKISFTEINYADSSEILTGTIEKFKMMKGYRPFMTSGNIALLTVAQQEITRISPSSVVGTSFVYIGKPRIVVKVNNKVIEDFEVDESPDEIIYSYYRFNNNFKPGDLVELIISKDLETRTQRFLVFRKGLESTFFFFENSNGLIEPFEFTGRRRVSSTIKHTTSSQIRKRVNYEKKVLSSNVQSLIVNTGQILKTDHRLVTSIIRSENVWCAADDVEGNYLMVDSTTTKLTNQDTNSSEEDFDIEFNIIEDADASIYPH